MRPDDSDPICPLCGRPIPSDVAQSRHHLVPRLKGGKDGETVLLHAICHAEIHAALSEAEIARDHATIEALRAHPRIAAFVRWVARRPPGFTSHVPGPRRTKKRH
ncbi:HNH endonuclease [Defluviimonas sp. SAOS-178_SWC]|uniref:HNH endonuclease n=1 Tax=Defluviimonas sp. SAOS-178_SWC TaxID=3121287 RepID=UPI00322151AE